MKISFTPYGHRPALLLLLPIISLSFLILLVRLLVMQTVQQEDFARQAQQVSQLTSYLPARRGVIYYRNMGKPLVSDRDWFSLYVTPGLVQGISNTQLAQRLSVFLQQPSASILQKIQPNQSFRQVLLANGIPFEKMTGIMERTEEFPGVSFQSKPRRHVNVDGSIVHVLGYVGRISPEELEQLYGQRYRLNDMIGKSGVEKTYDFLLRGEGGEKIETIDAFGEVLDTQITAPVSGSDLVLTIDGDIQQLAEKALGKRVGVAVVMRANTGEILAMVSSPWYSPNTFDSQQDYQQVVTSPLHPLINRAIQSAFAPASTFKLVVATALLAEPNFSVKAEIFDPGYWQYGNRLFRNWKRDGQGIVNFSIGVAASNNIYFGKMGVLTLGIEKIANYAHYFGLGSRSGIDLEGEVPGLVPTPAWKRQNFNEGWTGGDTLNVSIGQGYMQATPLQVALYTAAIANSGVLYRPYVVKSIINQDARTAEEREPEELQQVPLPPERWALLQKAMRETVTASYGTARHIIYNGVVDVAAKTGTAELGFNNNWHSWFASYGPYQTEDPNERVVVVTMTEATQEAGSEGAYDWWAPKAADIIYRGIFAREDYETVIRGYQKRGVWFARNIVLPAEETHG